MASLPPLSQVFNSFCCERCNCLPEFMPCITLTLQLAGNHGPLFDGLWEKLDSRGGGHIDAAAAAAFLKKSQLREPLLHKVAMVLSYIP